MPQYLKDSTIRTSIAAGDYIYFGSKANGDADSKILKSLFFTSPTMVTPVLGAASATSLAVSAALTAATFNGLALTASTGTITIANSASLITTGAFALTLAVGANVTLTVPTTSATLARTDAAQTFTGTQTFSGTIAGAAITATSLATTAGITSASPSAGMGYATGAGGIGTQSTNRTTTVVMVPNPCLCGQITTQASSMAARTVTTFTVTNSAVALGDVVNISKVSGDVDTQAWVNSVAAGSFTVTLYNTHSSDADVTAFVFNFAIQKAVSA